MSEARGERHGRGGLVRLDAPDVLPVRARHNQRVAPRCRWLAEEGEEHVVRIDDLLLGSPRRDLAERAGGGLDGSDLTSGPRLG
jgi:hypothetical protein